MIEIDEVKGRKITLKVSGKDFFKDLNFIKKEMVGRKYNEATKMWEIPILKTNFKRLKEAGESFADDDALWAFQADDYETYLTAEKEEDKIVVNVYQDKEIREIIKKHRSRGDRNITLESQINLIIYEISQLEEETKKMMDDKVKDLAKYFEKIKDDAALKLRDQIQELKTNFDNIKDIIANNIEKLKLGVLRDSVVDFVGDVFDREIVKIILKVNDQFSDDQISITEDSRKIIERLDSEFIKGLSASIYKMINKWDKKKYMLKEETWNKVKDKIIEVLKEREEKYEINC